MKKIPKVKRKVAVYDQKMLSRLKAFTDAMMSIVATIMVIDLPLPKGLNFAAFLPLFTPFVVYLVSYLVILSFYFRVTKIFNQIEKISGWQIFSYAIWLLFMSLFPLMTRLITMYSGRLTWVLVFYIIYLAGITRGLEAIRVRILLFNGKEKVGHRRELSVWIVVVLAIIPLFFGFYWLPGVILLALPLLSLIRSVVYE